MCTLRTCYKIVFIHKHINKYVNSVTLNPQPNHLVLKLLQIKRI